MMEVGSRQLVVSYLHEKYDEFYFAFLIKLLSAILSELRGICHVAILTFLNIVRLVLFF